MGAGRINIMFKKFKAIRQANRCVEEPREDMPENMRVESKEHLMRLIKQAVDEDDGTYYTFDDIYKELGLSRKRK